MSRVLTKPESAPRDVVGKQSFATPDHAPDELIGIGIEERARILYVDDEPRLRRLVEVALIRSGYEVDTAADGAEAWEALQHVHYNLLITDNEMPRLTGLQLAARARFAGMRLPIVLSSGSPDAFDGPSVARLRVATCLQKPFGVDTLIETVELALRFGARRRTAESAMSAMLQVTPFPHGGINE